MLNLIPIKNAKRACLLDCQVKHVKNWFAYRRKLLRPKLSSENNQEIINEQSTYSGYVNFNVNSLENIPSGNILGQNECSQKIYPLQNNNFCFPQNFLMPEYKFHLENSNNNITWVAVPFTSSFNGFQGPLRAFIPVKWDST